MEKTAKQKRQRSKCPLKQSMKSNHPFLCPKLKSKKQSGLETNKFQLFNVPSYKTDAEGLLYNCIHCETAFYSLEAVKEHLGTVHADLHYFCEQCGQYFSNNWQLRRHKKVYPYNCDHCDYSGLHYAQFRLHSKRIHNIQLKPRYRSENRQIKAFECNLCGYQVLVQHMYEKHMKTVHSDLDSEARWRDDESE